MKKNLLITLLLLVVFSCKDDEKGIVSPDREYSPRVIQETYGNAKLVGFVNDKNGSPLADATVFFGTEKTTTASDGSYQLNTLSAGTKKRIWFEKDGYASTQKLADISEELPNRIDASLFPIGKIMKMTSDGGKIEDENFSVELEPGGFIYLDGTPVEEAVIVEATAFLTTEDEFLDAFPGEFRGTRTDGTTTAIESFGFIDVELKVESGEPVQMAEGVNATIKIKAPENAPSTIPMWHYDEDKAEWIEEGTGTLNEGFYTADVTHFTKWNWDRPYDETSKIVGRVIDSDGNPIEGATVVQKGITYRFQNSTKTNADGEFELLTPESNNSDIEAQFDIYGSTVVNYTTSSTKGQTNDIGDIIIDVSIDNIIPPIISNDVLYITMGKTAIIKGNYFGEEKRIGYKLLLNGNEIETTKWENGIIEFKAPIGTAREGQIQINRDGYISREVNYKEGDWTCEIDGIKYYNPDVAKAGGNNSLFLRYKSLDYVPDCIGNLRSLNIIFFNENKLTSLPESIGKLEYLRELLLNQNELTNLPENIGNLKILQKLIVDENSLTSLPESIGNLNYLKELTLNDNQLINLPESIGNLNYLKELILNDNQLTSLPESIRNLKNLEKLHINNNNLIKIPESIGDLERLNTLLLNQNELTILPESIGKLKNLTDLRISDNNNILLPKSIGNMNKLKLLNLKGNNLNSLPETIKNLKGNLEFIDLRHNNFTEEEKAKIEGWLPDTDIYWE